MAITYRTLGAWGAGKGSNLLPSEVDANFYELAQAIADLVADPAVPNGIETISVSGTQMTIHLTNGDALGPFTLPVLTFRWREEWEPDVPYAVLDVVKVTGVGIFMCQVAHTSEGPDFLPGLLDVDDNLIWLQLFGSADGALLSTLGDVTLGELLDQDILMYFTGSGKWSNTAIGSMIYQNADAVDITGGRVRGLSAPTDGDEAATKDYVDAGAAGASVTNNRIMANISGSTGPVTASTLSAILDAIVSSSRGTILFRGSSAWTGLAPGTSGQVLQTAGSGGDPSWSTNGGGLLSITSPASRDMLLYNSTTSKFENVRRPYQIHCFVAGVPSASQNLLYHRFSKAMTLPANLAAYLDHATIAGGSVAATADTAIVIQKALAASPTSFSTVATLTIVAGAVVASLSTQAAISFAQGDVLRVRAPASPDATFADFHMTLTGYET